MGQIQTKIKINPKSKSKSKSESKPKPKYDSREEYFIKNGAILLEKHIALSQGRDIGYGQLKVYSYKDIEKATRNYDQDLVVGRSDFRTVYKATLDDRIVVIKVLTQLDPDPKLIEPFLTEASTAMVMIHDNMEKLIGCCLETFVPISVHEYLPNQSLCHHLHAGAATSKHIQWVDCLRVVIDTAYALSYMHNALSKPVVHRYLHSNIILLDYSFHAKLTNFGFSLPITPGETTQKWPVEGRVGYIDPEYVETQEVTVKCDVYSFGVLLLELLTRRQPCIMARGGTDLVDVFITAVEKNCMMEMIGNEVLEQATMDEIGQVAQLALMCVAKKGTERPTMIEVIIQLRQIRGQENRNVEPAAIAAAKN